MPGLARMCVCSCIERGGGERKRERVRARENVLMPAPPRAQTRLDGFRVYPIYTCVFVYMYMYIRMHIYIHI